MAAGSHYTLNQMKQSPTFLRILAMYTIALYIGQADTYTFLKYVLEVLLDKCANRAF